MKYIISPTVTLFHSDCIETMKSLPDNSVDSCVCDPPYHLNSIVKRFGADNAAPALSSSQRRFAETGGGDRPPGSDQFGRLSKGFMGKRWDGGDIAFQIETWREVWRVLKPGGYVAAFGAPKNFGRLQCAILDAGFEERDCILNLVDPSDAIIQFIESLSEAQLDAFMKCLTQSELSGFLAWTFGVGFPKGRDIGKDTGLPEWSGFNVALKPAFEPIVLARKPLSEGTVAANVLRWGTGALNIDGCRVASPGETITNHARSGDAEVLFGASKAQETYQSAGQAAGRWPANVVHDGSDEVVGAFPDSKGQQGDLNATGRARPTKTCLGDMAPPLPHKARNDSGSAARFFYSAKASAKDRNGSKHPTVKPISLMEWLATLITPPGGTILDPFAGSGTTGAAARNKGFSVILCEREAEYVEDIKRRMSAPIVAAAVAAQQPANDNDPAASQLDIFGKAA